MRMVLGTRGSDLARAQTSMVETALRQAFPELEIAIEIIRTSGDEGTPRPPNERLLPQGRKGMFTGGNRAGAFGWADRCGGA